MFPTKHSKNLFFEERKTEFWLNMFICPYCCFRKRRRTVSPAVKVCCQFSTSVLRLISYISVSFIYSSRNLFCTKVKNISWSILLYFSCNLTYLSTMFVIILSLIIHLIYQRKIMLCSNLPKDRSHCHIYLLSF